jgi:hypothetical protein
MYYIGFKAAAAMSASACITERRAPGAAGA